MSESFEYEMHRALDECKADVGTDTITGCYSMVLANLDRVTAAHIHEIEQMRKASFHEGYVAGQRSMDAEHRAVAMRLRRLPLDGGSHENLSAIARAVYPTEWGWTKGACSALRDKLVELMGGIHDDPVPVAASGDAGCDDCHHCDGEAWRVTYDELGNERHKAVCELRRWIDTDGEFYPEIFFDELFEMLGCEEKSGKDAGEQMCDRLIHLLGGDEPNFTEIAETIKLGDEFEDKRRFNVRIREGHE